MPADNLLTLRNDARAVFDAAVKAVDPYRAVQTCLRLDGDMLALLEGSEKRITLNLNDFERVFIVGGGKATAPMARAVEDVLGPKITQGIVVVKYGFGEPLVSTRVIEAGHPLPDRRGEEGAKEILALLENAGAGDLIFSLISGGGSALLPQPAADIRLEEKQDLTGRLLRCGASIDEINALRKHISSVKGGQMAKKAYPATTLNLMLSDVVGDRMDVIASGPFTPDPSTFRDAQSILEKYGLQDIPPTILGHLKNGLQGKIPETPKPGDPIFEKVHNFIVGSNIIALRAAEEQARCLGYHTLVLSSMIEGETRDVARMHTAIAKETLKTGHPAAPPLCVISGGETTVTLRGEGLGGRNQEFCLAAAMDMDGLPPRAVILSGGTDGNDGPTDAAGATVDPFSVKRGADAGLDAALALRNNDAYPFFEKTGDLLLTGPTRTNVMDVHLVLVK